MLFRHHSPRQSSGDSPNAQPLPRPSSKPFHIELTVTLQRILSNEALTARLLAHLETTMCDEGLSFVLAVRNHLPTQLIIQTYVQDSAPKQINLKHKVRRDLLLKYNAGDVLPNLFDEAVDEMMYDIRQGDGFVSFITADAEARSLVTDSMALLGDFVLNHPDSMSKLIADAQTKQPDIVSMLRFLSMSAELSTAPNKDMFLRKLCSLFVESGSKFEIPFDSKLRAQLVRGDSLAFEEARFGIIETLSMSTMVMSFVRTSISTLDVEDVRALFSNAKVIKQIMLGLEKDAASAACIVELKMIAMIDEYFQAKDKVEQEGLGRKLVSVFVQPGGKFEVGSLSDVDRKKLLEFDFGGLRKTRSDLISVVLQSDKVKTALRMDVGGG